MNINLNVKFRDLNKEEREMVENHLKSIRNFLLETSKGLERPLSFDYDFGDPRVMGDGIVHEKTRSISVRGRRRLDGTIEYSVLGCSGRLTQCLAKEDQDEHESPAAGWEDDFGIQLIKYWSEIKKAFLNYIKGIEDASCQLQDFQL